MYGSHIEDMVRRLVEAADPFGGLSAGAQVVIKPNLVISRSRWEGVNTHPQVVETLIQLLKEKGIGSITVADGSGMGHSATKAFEVCGYSRVAQKYGVELVDLEKDKFITRKPSIKGPFSSLYIAKTVARSDFLINVPVMKAHGQTKITCSLKNLKGVMPRSMKTSFHGKDLHMAIAQLNSVVSADFILVDGIYGDLTSETGGTPVAINTMLAGYHPLEVDAFVARRLGFAPFDILHIRHFAGAAGAEESSLSTGVQYLNRPVRQQKLRVDTNQFRRYRCRVTSQGACCTCQGNLMFALERLSKSRSLSSSQHFAIGQKVNVEHTNHETIICVGECAAKRLKGTTMVYGCPPSSRDIVEAVLG
ncbi:MAG: DUF362 domain-containing protein [Spirochaetota bacterium]